MAHDGGKKRFRLPLARNLHFTRAFVTRRSKNKPLRSVNMTHRVVRNSLAGRIITAIIIRFYVVGLLHSRLVEFASSKWKVQPVRPPSSGYRHWHCPGESAIRRRRRRNDLRSHKTAAPGSQVTAAAKPVHRQLNAWSPGDVSPRTNGLLPFTRYPVYRDTRHKKFVYYHSNF